jgi:4-hydroxy-tetrahydrodipicolinate synthase
MASPAKKAKTENATAETKRIRSLRLMTAVKTPYSLDGNIDLAAFDKIVEHQIANGVEGLIVGGTTGEGHLMHWDEHLILITHAAAKYKGKIAIVGNTGSNNTAEAEYATKKGFAAGMDASLLINPYYGKTSPKGIIQHLLKGGLEYGPAIIYNVPSRTGQDIKPELIMELASHKHFCGVKECMGHERIKLLSDQGIACWSGNDDECMLSRHAHGGVGVISVTANVVPGLMAKIMAERDDELDAKLKPLYKWLFTEPNPIGVNTMLMQLGLASPAFRLPYVARDKVAREEGVQVLKEIGLEHCASQEIKVMEDADFKHLLSGDSA